MKYLKKYENYTDRANRSKLQKDVLTEEDYNIIETELFDKFKENNIKSDANALYFELR